MIFLESLSEKSYLKTTHKHRQTANMQQKSSVESAKDSTLLAAWLNYFIR